VVSPLAAAAAAEHLGARAAFGLTQIACAAALAVTVAPAWRARHAFRQLPDTVQQPAAAHN